MPESSPQDAGLIDVHTHVVPESIPAYAGRGRRVPWPSMVPAHACHRHVMISGAVFRTVSHRCWDCALRQADMAERGVTRQVLSPMPELLGYWLTPRDGEALCRHLNEVIASMVRQAPQQFSGLAAVPLQDLDRAIEMLHVAVRELGLAGVEIATNVRGVPIGDARFLPFFEAAEALGAAVFVHPLRPPGMDRLVGPSALEQVLGFPGETGLAAASLLTGGVLARLPRLRIALSHGGGTLGLLLPRLRQAWQALPEVRATINQDPMALARRLYVDSLVYDLPTLHHLIGVFGEQQVMVGSDYPFAIQDPDPAARIDALGVSPRLRQQLRSGNAKRWLGRAGQAGAAERPAQRASTSQA